MATNTLPEMGFFDKHRDKIELGAPSGCWLWNATVRGKGYGLVWARGKMRGAHRVAYETAHGEGSADGLVVRHKCDVRPCVNPDHLEIGTIADNNRDMMERGRHVAMKGEAHCQAKLTEADVRTIRATYVSGCHTHGQHALARRFGVSRPVIGEVIRREIWTHVS